MNKSWRIGIDEKNKIELVNAGIFSYSRNPIFLGMMLTLTGLFLISPSGLTFNVLIMIFVFLQIQIRLEEEFLTKLHEEKYLGYRKATRLWL